MRHLGWLVVSGLAIFSSTAHALDHQMKVGEILLSKNGSTGIQFIELQDPGEMFPNGPYRVEIYNAAATLIGMVTVPVPANTTRVFVATAAADTEFGTTRDATLPVTLPADGQACFVSNANIKIHCVAWGCLTTLLIGASRAPSPPDGQSAQMQATFTYQLATPTPDATNQAGTTAANCPTEPDAPPAVDGPPTGGDAGVIPDGGGSNGGNDAGTGGNNNGDGGGCCQVDGSRSALGAMLLALGVVLALRRSRRR